LAAALQDQRPTTYERIVKPVIDRVVAALLIMVLTPVLLVVWLTVLLALGRPALLGQQRGGVDGKPFTMLKFRTMLPDRRRPGSSGSYHGPERRLTHKSLDDPRHTRFGRLMRKMSLDELPQLFNVLFGHMSLVGPRPELFYLIDGYAPWQRTRHVVKPGVTGLWQTTARSRGLRLHECIDLDLLYIDRLSLRTDLAILGRTPLALLRVRNVI
jgi:lipopolysaccharide/colanic/teichoic acid biosynthesis glycosyltransferase